MDERRCKICGKLLEDWEDDICTDDQSSMMQDDGMEFF